MIRCNISRLPSLRRECVALRLLLPAGIVRVYSQTLQTAGKCGRLINAIEHIHVVGENFPPRAQRLVVREPMVHWSALFRSSRAVGG